MTKTIEQLAERPKFERLKAVSGLAASPERSPVDREGGMHSAGMISGVAAISRGPALGHGMFVDSTAVEQTVALLNASKSGIKSRFTHPGLSSDGMGKHLGRAVAGRVDGDSARADLHFSKTAHNTPDGDLAAYVSDLAEEDPEAFGLSIVFEHDIEAENAFVEEHGGTVVYPEYGYYDLTNFKSPDPENTDNSFHVRLKELRAVDVVDEPAANASGLFHRGQEIPVEADALCAYAFGLSDTRPASASLGIDPDRLRGFASRFLSHRGLTLAQKGDGTMPQPGTKLTEGTETATPPTETPVSETPVETTPTETAATETAPAETPAEETSEDPKEAALSAFRADLAKFSALDPVEGPKWLSEGKSFEDAQSLKLASLQSANGELQGKLTAALAAAGGSPIEAGHDGTTAPSKPTAGLSEGQSRFANAIKIPSRN